MTTNPQSSNEQGSDYSIRFRLDIKRREKPTLWLWLVVLVALLIGSPLVGRLIERLL